MTTALVVTILVAVVIVMAEIAHITAVTIAYWAAWRGAGHGLADQPTADDVGQPAKGMGL